jgi:hypothetical protein
MALIVKFTTDDVFVFYLLDLKTTTTKTTRSVEKLPDQMHLRADESIL